MRARPILFSGPMIRALLEGRKTQTRRILKCDTPIASVGSYADWDRFKANPAMGTPRLVLIGDDGRPFSIPCPYGKPGDLLWVRETTIKVEDHGFLGPVYLASDEGRAIWDYGLGSNAEDIEISPDELRLRPAIHMPRTASRLTLRITDVCVQRLQEIGEADARAEGMPRYSPNPVSVDDFRQLWSSINGADNWAANPWVWAITFDVVNANVDEVLKGAA